MARQHRRGSGSHSPLLFYSDADDDDNDDDDVGVGLPLLQRTWLDMRRA
jgi:hypothetical protein